VKRITSSLGGESEMNFDKLIELLKELGQNCVEYILVGGAALNLHGILRTTEDIDLFVRTDVENIERLKSALRKVWNDPEIEHILASDLAGDYPTVRYGPPGEDIVIDIMGRLGSEVSYDDLVAEDLQVEGVVVHIATPATLFRMKRNTVRPVDRADAEALRRKFNIRDDDASKI
jgi:hypothetical protein